ncbi:MAG: hypothetical protein ABSA18_16425, partial [Dehalococcoidia bacterium]
MPDKNITEKSQQYASAKAEYYAAKEEHKEWKRAQKELRRNRRHNDPGGGYLFVGLLLIVIAAVFFLYQMHYLTAGNWLGAFMVGLGLVLIITGIRRSLVSRRGPFVPMGMIGGGVNG